MERRFPSVTARYFDDTDALIAATTMTFYHLEQGAEEKNQDSRAAVCAREDEGTSTAE